MNDVILVSGEGKAKEFAGERGADFNPERYHAFRDTFGVDNFGIVEAGDLKKEILTGVKSPVYLLDDQLRPVVSPRLGIESKLIIASNFENSGTLPTADETKFFLDYLEGQKQIGNIGDYINSHKSTLFEDKMSIIELQKAGHTVPQSYHFDRTTDLEEFLQSGESYIIKPRFGYFGKGVAKIDKNNFKKHIGTDITKFIVQEELDIQAESRLIFFDGNYLGARIIDDRVRPWETKAEAGRKHVVEKYVPSKDQIDESREIMKYSDTVWGCADWAHDSSGNQKFLELNGVGVGLGFKGGPYDLNKEVSFMIKDKYLKK